MRRRRSVFNSSQWASAIRFDFQEPSAGSHGTNLFSALYFHKAKLLCPLAFCHLKRKHLSSGFEVTVLLVQASLIWQMFFLTNCLSLLVAWPSDPSPACFTELRSLPEQKPPTCHHTVTLLLKTACHFRRLSLKQHSFCPERLLQSGAVMEGHSSRGIYESDGSNKQLKIICEAFVNCPSWAAVLGKDNLWFLQNSLKTGSFICSAFGN